MLVPGSVNPLLLTSAAGAAGGGVSRSLRFNSADSAYLSRTPGSAGNRKTWSFSCWVKRGTIGGSYQNILSAANSVSDRYEVYFDTSTNQLTGEIRIGGTGYIITTTQVFRDPSAWYHILVVMDTSQATASNRHKFYVNGTQVTNFASASYPNQDATPQWNAADPHSIGRYQNGASQYLDGYLADVYFIDGQALDPSSFTETDATTGQLIPLAYTGSYGTNGFHLEFSDNSGTTSTTLGKDAAGSNNWTPNNFSVASGSGNDSLVDTPTSYGTDTGAGNEVRGNYCTWNPLDNGSVTLSNGNLDGSATVAWKNVRGTFAFPSSGKWYYEVTPGGSALLGVGIAAANKNLTDQSTGTFVTYNEDGRFYKDGSINASGKATYTSGDVIGIAFDCDTNSVTFYKNNVSQGSVTPTTGVSYFPFVQIYNSSLSANWGSRPFAYTAPSGFKALCDTNLPSPLIAKGSTAMDVKLYTGNGSSQTISGVNFSPDYIWLKARSSAFDHGLIDIVRGAGNYLVSNSTAAEASGTTAALTSDGFTLGGGFNNNGVTYVSWMWDAGSSTVTNTQGSITSSVRANASAGFSIVTYTGNGSSTGATVGHGLGVEPSFFIIKNRSASSDWVGYHKSVGSGFFLILNSTSAAVSSAMWDGAPSSTVLKLNDNSGGTFTETNTNGQNYVAYCFAPVAGYSSFGSYTGNGSSTDGPFVYTGFRPRWIMVKCTQDIAGDVEQWVIKDTARSSYNEAFDNLYANLSNAEDDASGSAIDILSNGFKPRGSYGGINGSATYIYAAFAESPLNYSRAR